MRFSESIAINLAKWQHPAVEPSTVMLCLRPGLGLEAIFYNFMALPSGPVALALAPEVQAKALSCTDNFRHHPRAQGPATTGKVKLNSYSAWNDLTHYSCFFRIYLNEYLSKSNQNLVYYLSCQVVTRTAYLNFCSGRMLKSLDLIFGTYGLGLGLEGPVLGLEGWC